MHNWSTDLTRMKEDPELLAVWRLEQQLNYGLEEGEQIDGELAKKHLSTLRIDQDTRNLLNFLLYDQKPAHPKPE